MAKAPNNKPATKYSHKGTKTRRNKKMLKRSIGKLVNRWIGQVQYNQLPVTRNQNLVTSNLVHLPDRSFVANASQKPLQDDVIFLRAAYYQKQATATKQCIPECAKTSIKLFYLQYLQYFHFYFKNPIHQFTSR